MIESTDVMRITTARIAAGAPRRNWLPITRKDEDMDIVLRIYVPDLAKMKTWTAPQGGETGDGWVCSGDGLSGRLSLAS